MVVKYYCAEKVVNEILISKKGYKGKTSILQISIMHYPINNNDVFTILFSNNLKLFSNDMMHSTEIKE